MRRQGGKESTDLLPPESADPVLTPASSRQPVLSWLALRRPRTAFPLLSAPPPPSTLHSCCKRHPPLSFSAPPCALPAPAGVRTSEGCIFEAWIRLKHCVLGGEWRTWLSGGARKASLSLKAHAANHLLICTLWT